MAYPCDSEDGNAAVMLITNLDNGDTFACCGRCFPVWVASAAQQFAAARDVVDVPLPPDGQDPAGTGQAEPSPADPDPAPDPAPRPRSRALPRR